MYIIKKQSNLAEKPKVSRKKWGIPAYVIMATMYQESKFIANARPINHKQTRSIKNKHNGKKQTTKSIPKYMSSAYGYAQAIDTTWELYKSSNGNKDSRRDNFHDAADFIGWYMNTSHKKNNIPKYRADLQYLNYHEGWLGYKLDTHKHKNKKWLLQVAQKVEAIALNYKAQLRSCTKKFFIARKKKTTKLTSKNWF